MLACEINGRLSATGTLKNVAGDLFLPSRGLIGQPSQPRRDTPSSCQTEKARLREVCRELDAAGDLFLRAYLGNLASGAETHLPRATRRRRGSAGRSERSLWAWMREKEQRRELDSERP